MAISIPKAVYSCGDTRLNCFEIPAEEDTIKSQTASVAALIFESSLEYTKDWCGRGGYYSLSGVVKLNQTTDTVPLISGGTVKLPIVSKFGEEPAAAFGTTFLIHERYALTAAHCLCFDDAEGHSTNEIDMDRVNKTKIVFGYVMLDSKRCRTRFRERDVYGIKRVVAHLHDMDKITLDKDKKNYNDWALLELDRPVKGRAPLELEFSEEPKRFDKVYMLGYPQGLPLKYAPGGIVMQTEIRNRFGIEIPSFPGNSGSPLFNKNKKVVGHLCAGLPGFTILEDCLTQKELVTREFPLSEREILKINCREIAQNISSLVFVDVFLKAEKGDKGALLKLSRYYRYGVFVPRDVEKCVELLNKVQAASSWKWWLPSYFTKCEALALNDLGDVYSPIASRLSDLSWCRGIFQAHSAKVDPIKTDIFRAVSYWINSASLGNGDACFYIAELIEEHMRNVEEEQRRKRSWGHSIRELLNQEQSSEPFINKETKQRLISFKTEKLGESFKGNNEYLREAYLRIGVNLGSGLCAFKLHKEYESKQEDPNNLSKHYKQLADKYGFTLEDYNARDCAGCQLLFNL